MPIKEKPKPAEDPKPAPGENPASAGIGHNEPPLEDRIQMEFRDALLDERPDFMVLRDNLLSAVDRIEVTDDETLGKAGNMVKRYRTAIKYIEETHKSVKQPYWDAGKACDAEKTRLIGPLEDAMKSANQKMNAFMAKREAEMQAERERIAAEERRKAAEAAEAERRRQEAEGVEDPDALAEIENAPLAAAQTTKRDEPVRSDEGTAVSGRKVWNSRVEDYDLAYMAVSDNEKVREAIDRAIAGLVRAGSRKIEGVRIWPTTQAVAR